MAAKKSDKKSGSHKHVLIIKRRGHNEKFDERKIYASCYEACRSIAMTEKESENVCEKVTRDMKAWLKGKKHIDSQQIFKEMVKIMGKYNQDAAFMYETHRDIS